MIVADRFVFLHLHKSGGTFVNTFLAQYFPSARQIGYHLPRAYLPEAARSLPIFGLVRNPWSYYVSWYSFQVAKPKPNPIYAVASEQGRLGFAGTVRNLVNLCDEEALRVAITRQLPDHFVNHGINLTRRCLEPIGGSGLGFYSFLFRRMFGDGSGVTFGRMESLRQDLLEFAQKIGIDVTLAMRDFLVNAAPLNTSRHEPYQSYYTPELRELVAVRDRLVIEQFGYVFE